MWQPFTCSLSAGKPCQLEGKACNDDDDAIFSILLCLFLCPVFALEMTSCIGVGRREWRS